MRRYRLDHLGTFDPPAPAEPPVVVVAPDQPPREDARLDFDPATDRVQVDATTDRFRLNYLPASADSTTTVPSVAKILAFPAGSIEPGATLEQVLAIEPIATVEVPVGGLGRHTVDLGGLPAGQPYTAAILTGFEG